jgi:hypothetical protein
MTADILQFVWQLLFLYPMYFCTRILSTIYTQVCCLKVLRSHCQPSLAMLQDIADFSFKEIRKVTASPYKVSQAALEMFDKLFVVGCGQAERVFGMAHCQPRGHTLHNVFRAVFTDSGACPGFHSASWVLKCGEGVFFSTNKFFWHATDCTAAVSSGYWTERVVHLHLLAFVFVLL